MHSLIGVALLALASSATQGALPSLVSPTGPVGTAASPDQAPPDPSSTAAASRTVQPLGADVDYVCDLNPQYPHASHHVPGTVAAQSEVTCNVPIAEIGLKVDLYYYKSTGWYLEATNSGSDEETADFSVITAFDGCIDGNWKNYTTFTGVAPPGTVPPTLSESEPSYATVSCPEYVSSH